MSTKICVCSICVLKYQRIYYQLAANVDVETNLYLSRNLYIVWYGAFLRWFQPVSDWTQASWSLLPDSRRSDMTMSFIESAKVRYVCQNCGNVWTSMSGCAEFWVYREPHQFVLSFKLYGQKCVKCLSKDFQTANWYPEEVEKVMENASQRIVESQQSKSVRPTRKGNPHGCHVSEGCEACQNRLCTTTIITVRKRNESSNTAEVLSIYDTEEEESLPSLKGKNCTSDYESQDESPSLQLRRSVSVPEPQRVNEVFFACNEC